MAAKVSRFRMQYVGEEKEVYFVCSDCVIELRDNPVTRQTRYYEHRSHQAGECIYCEGTGFMPRTQNMPCSHCNGSGLCSNCGGKYARDWSELPNEVQNRWTERWELFGAPFKSYAAAGMGNRKW